MAETTQVKAKSTLTKFEQFKLRMALFGIWFVKNLKVWLWLLFIVFVGLSIAGVIGENVPIFGELSKVIREQMIKTSEAGFTLYSISSSVLTIAFSIGLCAFKVKRLTIKDIKSRKMKITLIKAGLYFNERGKLTRRVETITKTDINNDGKIGDIDICKVEDHSENIIQSLKQAGEEFVTIVKLDLSNIEKDNENEAYKSVGLDDEKEGIDNLIIETGNDATKLLDPSIDTEDPEDMPIKEKKKNVFRRLLNAIKGFFGGIKESFNTAKDLSTEEKTNIAISEMDKKLDNAISEYKETEVHIQNVTEVTTNEETITEPDEENAVIDTETKEEEKAAQPIIENVHTTNKNADSAQSQLDDMIANLLRK